MLNSHITEFVIKKVPWCFIAKYILKIPQWSKNLNLMFYRIFQGTLPSSLKNEGDDLPQILGTRRGS